jgi:long-chain acyl-CoA synthetase
VLKVKEGLGGHVRLVLSGAAPLSPHVEEFLRVVMCAPVLQGYGMNLPCFIFHASLSLCCSWK